jgi:hypothetical protein
LKLCKSPPSPHPALQSAQPCEKQDTLLKLD